MLETTMRAFTLFRTVLPADIAALLCAAIFALWLHAYQTSAHAARIVYVPHFHAMPCPAHNQPNRLTVSWNISTLPRSVHRGERVIRQTAEVRGLYQDMCGTELTTYDRPPISACPAAPSISIYHLNFQHNARSILRITERFKISRMAARGAPSTASPRFSTPSGGKPAESPERRELKSPTNR